MAATHDLSAHAHHQDEGEHNKKGENRTKWVVGITVVMMIGELVVGFMTESVALQADGWHMGTHVGALGLTLAAYWYARRHAGSDTFSFGTGKVYALAGYTSGIVLAIVAILLAVEGIEHLATPEPVDYSQSLPVAVLGLVVNLTCALLLGTGHHYGHEHGNGNGNGHAHGHAHAHDHHHAPAKKAAQAGTLDFNMRAAYIHIMADAFTSMLAIIALALGKYADLWYLDPTMGLVGGAVIIWWSASLCRQASGQLLDVVSSHKHEEVVRRQLEAIDDVRVADLHVWELGPGRRSCIVSVVTATPRDVAFYRDAVLGALPVAHLTIEIHRCDMPHDAPHVHDHADHAH
jgi:cation diffusion facilitator family transporter